MEKCFKCKENTDLKYCQRCDLKFCLQHITTHLVSKTCLNCGKNICLEMMGIPGSLDGDLCRRCEAESIINNLEKFLSPPS